MMFLFLLAATAIQAFETPPPTSDALVGELIPLLPSGTLDAYPLPAPSSKLRDELVSGHAAKTNEIEAVFERERSCYFDASKRFEEQQKQLLARKLGDENARQSIAYLRSPDSQRIALLGDKDAKGSATAEELGELSRLSERYRTYARDFFWAAREARIEIYWSPEFQKLEAECNAVRRRELAALGIESGN